ncbi:MAG: ATP-dependent transcriptional regulator, malt-like, luxr family protein [Acidimicrobiales bacterium]|nr:ATP-dependent transcriptional regulator, malt-like, luxr family protein [Acidimicrobiales bacterium]
MSAQGTAVADWPFVGRNTETRRLDGWAASLGPALCVLSGEAGSGKSRLAFRWLASLPPGTPHELVLCGRELADVSFGCLGPLIGQAGQEPTSLPGTAAEASLRRVTRAGGLVVVEDAHWIDAASALLLQDLVTDEAVRVLLTLRSGERVRPELADLLVAGAGIEVELGVLDDAELDQLLSEAFGGPVDPAFVASVRRMTDGNPLYVRELVSGRLGTDAVLVDGLWTLAGPLAVSPLLTDLISAHIDTLSPPARVALGLITEAGTIEEVHLLALVTPEAVEEAEAAGLVERLDQDGVRALHVAHALFQEVEQARTPLVERRALRQQLADGLLGLERPGDVDFLRASRWRLGALKPVGDDDLQRVVEVATRSHDFRLAADCARRLWIHLGTPAAALQLGDALFALHARYDLVEMEDVLAESQATMSPLDERYAEVVAMRELNLSVGLNRARPSLALLERWAEPGADQAETARRAMVVGTALFFSGLPDRAIEAFEHVDPVTHPHSGVFKLNSYWCAGRIAEVRADIDAVPEADREPWMIALRSSCHLFQGEFDAAHEVALDCVSALQRATIEDAVGNLTAYVVAGWACRLAGRSTQAVELFETAVPLGIGVAIIPLGMRAGAAAEVGDLALVRRSLASIEAILGAGGHAEAGIPLGAIGLDAVTLYASAPGRAWAALAEGRSPAEAGTILRSTAARLSELGQHLNAAWVLSDATCLRQLRRGDLARFAEAQDRVGGRWVPLWREHAAVVLDRDVAGLRSVAQRFAAMGDVRSAVYAAWAAWLFALDSGTSRAAAAREELDALVERTDWHPMFRPPPAELRDLTPRELQVARLAAQGLRSRDVAERLDLAVRTVDNNLQRIYSKLGVSGRAALRDLGGSDPPGPNDAPAASSPA